MTDTDIGRISAGDPPPPGSIIKCLVTKGQMDPRTQRVAEEEQEFELRLVGMVQHDEDDTWLLLADDAANATFSMSLDHWNDLYAASVTEIRFPPKAKAKKTRKKKATRLRRGAAPRREGPEGGAGAEAHTAPGRPALHRMALEAIAVPEGKNPRMEFAAARLLELTESIREVGLLQPIVCRELPRGKAELVFGERRLRACKAAGDEYIDVLLYPAGTLDDRIVADMKLAENFQREDLNHIEIARALGAARDAGRSIGEIAANIHKSDDFVRKHLDLLRLAEPVGELVARGRLPVKQAELIARVGDEDGQLDLAADAIRGIWDEDERRFDEDRWGAVSDGDVPSDYVMPALHLREALGRHMKTLGKCGWPMGEEYAGRRACAGCPDNTASEPELFEGVRLPKSKKGVCTNDMCFTAKWEAWEKQRAEKKAEKVARARAAGKCVCRECGAIAEAPQGRRKTPEGWNKPDLCGKCGRKGESAGSDWQAEERAKEKAIRESPEFRWAKAIHAYGVDVLARLVGRLKEGDMSAEALACVVRIGLSRTWWEIGLRFQSGKKTEAAAREAAEALRSGAVEISGAELAGLLEAAAREWLKDGAPKTWGRAPYIDSYSVAILGCLEALAERWGMDLPVAPPSLKQFQVKAAEAETAKTPKAAGGGKKKAARRAKKAKKV